MPRHLRISIPSYAEHIIQRGNNRQPIFACDAGIKAYAYWLEQIALLTRQRQMHAKRGRKEGWRKNSVGG